MDKIYTSESGRNKLYNWHEGCSKFPKKADFVLQFAEKPRNGIPCPECMKLDKENK